MANVTLSVTETAVNVSTTLSNIIVTDSDGGQTFNVSTTSSVIAVTAPVTSVIVSQSAGVSNTDVRTAISAYDAGGYGSFTYDTVTGVFTYTGVESPDIWNSLSNISPINFYKSNGTISIDTAVLFDGKTTDDLPQGTSNIYFSTTGAAVNTTNLPEGTNLYFTPARARGNVSAVDAGGYGSFSYNSTTGEFTYTGPTDSDVRPALSASNVTLSQPTYGSLSYNNTTGVFSYTGVSRSQILGLFSADSPISFSNGVISLNPFANITTSGIITGGWLVGGNSVITGTLTSNVVNANSSTITGTLTAANVLLNGDRIDVSYDNVNYNNHLLTNSNTLVLGYPVGATTPGAGYWPLADYYDTVGIRVLSDINGVANAELRWNKTSSNTRQHYWEYTNVDPVTGTRTMVPFLTNASVLSYIATQPLTVGGNITTSANISGNYFIGNGSLLTGVTSLTNAQVLAYIATQPLSVGGNLDVTGNINATGNINYQNVTDLYVTDQKITLNSNAATNADVQIIANRPTATSTDLKWNESATRWEFTNNGTTYYPIPTNTTDLAEGSNLWFTTARANSAIDSRLIGGTGISYSSGTIALDFAEFDTGNIVEGSNLWFTTGRANSAIDARVDKAFVEGLGISYTSLTDKPSIPTHTSNLINDSGYITVANANVISVNGETGVVVLDTGDIAENGNLYFTTDRANTAIGAYQGTINTAGNITTSANVSGQYILGNGAFLTGITGGTGNYGDSNVTTLLANLGSNVISSTANISTTADINVSGNVYGNIVAEQINHPQPFGAILMNSIFVDELAIGRNPSNRIFISNYGGETVSQGQYLRVTSTSPQTATFENFGLSFSNIGSFGNVSAGDPANISYSQDTASVVRATLSGDVADITVTGVGSGDTGWIVIAQDLTGGRQLTLGSTWKMEGCTTGNPVNIARGSNEETLIFWTYDGSNYRATLHPNIGSNVSVDLKTTGNVSGNYILGNGAFLTGITASGGNYGDSNVTTLLANFGSNVISSSTQVNVGANLVANSSVITVTNGSNFIPYAERNLGLTIDRNNNTANASASVVTGSSIAYRGGFSPDRIVFSGIVDGYFDGQPVTISGFTDATLAGALNGNVFYLRARAALPGTYDIYSDASMTTAVNLAVGNLTGTSAGPGTITFTRRNSVTPKEWSFNLDQVNNDLRIKEDGTTRVTVVSGGNVDITGTANANAIIVNQPGTAGTYANVVAVDASPGLFTGGSLGDVSNISNVFVSIFDSGQVFPIGAPFQMTFEGVTGPGNININGQTFYSNGVDVIPPDNVTVQLFTDPAATIPANAVTIGILPGNGTGSGNVSFTFTAGSAGDNWKLSTDGKLNFSYNGVEKANIDNGGNISTSANVNASAINVDKIKVDPAAAVTADSQGEIVWNTTYGGLDVAMNGINLEVGQQEVFYGKLTENVSKGNVIMFAGAQGDHFLLAKANVDSPGFIDEYIIGCAAEDGVTNDFIYVTTYGRIDAVDTQGFGAGNLLYLSTTTPGALTNVMPTQPDHAILIAAVAKEESAPSSNNGTIFVRPTFGKSHLDLLHDVKITTPADNQILRYDSGNTVWVNENLGTTITTANVKLKQFSETTVALGNVTGDQSSNINLANGSIFTMTATGNLTISSVTGATAGSSATLIITQDGTGSRLLTSTMKFAGGSKTLSTGANAIDIISLFYDGTTYYATLSKGYA